MGMPAGILFLLVAEQSMGDHAEDLWFLLDHQLTIPIHSALFPLTRQNLTVVPIDFTIHF